MPKKTEPTASVPVETGGADSISAASLPPSMEVVTLLRHHEHGGILRKPGELIEVTTKQKEWLGWHGCIQTEQPNTGE